MSSGKIGVTMNRYGAVLPKENYLTSFGRRININSCIGYRDCCVLSFSIGDNECIGAK